MIPRLNLEGEKVDYFDTNGVWPRNGGITFRDHRQFE